MCSINKAYDALTAEDIKTITSYIEAYGDVCLNTDLRNVLAEWDRCKSQFLFDKVFGGQLRRRFRLHVKQEKDEVVNSLKNVYKVPYFIVTDDPEKDFEEYFAAHDGDKRTNPFVWSFFSFMYGLVKEKKANATMAAIIVRRFVELIKYSVVVGNVLPYDIGYEIDRDGETKYVFVQAGSKVVKAIGNLLRNVGYDDMELFDSWKDAVSVCTTVKERDVDLVLSIHPIDFMTMSDNACNWRSCMSWDGGEYSLGTVEMMNSPYAIVGYIENSLSPTCLRGGHRIPNKEWRCLFFVTDECVLSGKAYPYRSDAVSKFGVEKLKDIAHEVFGHPYTDVQQYTDMKWYYDNYESSDSGSRYTVSSLSKDDWGWSFEGPDEDEDDDKYADRIQREFDDKIVVCVGDFMYNDFFEDCTYPYYIAKDARPFDMTPLDLGGDCTCMCCGDFIESDADSSKKYCDDCENKYYCIDDKLHPNEELYEFVVLGQFEKQLATYDMAVDMLWYRPDLGVYTRKDATTKEVEVFFCENAKRFAEVRCSGCSAEDLIALGREHKRYEKAFIDSLGVDCSRVNVYSKKGSSYYITTKDVEFIDDRYSRYRCVREVDMDDEEQDMCPVCV